MATFTQNKSSLPDVLRLPPFMMPKKAFHLREEKRGMKTRIPLSSPLGPTVLCVPMAQTILLSQTRKAM
jgi:hypothetical protein